MRQRYLTETRYVFVTGGVTSSLGKGILCASLGRLLQERGYRVTIQKFDPYLNVDPGTMSPYEHGECFITEDGAETDLDLGHYERFLNIRTSAKNNVTTGRVYFDLITKERKGDFLGKTIQVIPHVTDEIKKHVYALGGTNDYDIVITEIGGCVGDIESHPFIESIRQVRLEVGPRRSLFLHLTLVPYLQTTGELKTKPTQQSVKELLSLGIQPDMLVCRCLFPLSTPIREKIALYCNTPLRHVIEAINVDAIYEVPLMMSKEQLDESVLKKLDMTLGKVPKLTGLKDFVRYLKNVRQKLRIALIGKYVALHDAYISIQEALHHAGARVDAGVEIDWLSAEDIEQKSALLRHYDALLLAPGFGSRGFEGKVRAASYARTHGVPLLGICLGMQSAVVSLARELLHLPAHSTEIDADTSAPVIDLMEAQKDSSNKGATMRLGLYDCQLKEQSLAHKAYSKALIHERHRHRYELNADYIEPLSKVGVQVSGVNPRTSLAEIIELDGHPWFLGCQFHPEYCSSIEHPHPLFVSFLSAALSYKKSINSSQ